MDGLSSPKTVRHSEVTIKNRSALVRGVASCFDMLAHQCYNFGSREAKITESCFYKLLVATALQVQWSGASDVTRFCGVRKSGRAGLRQEPMSVSTENMNQQFGYVRCLSSEVFVLHANGSSFWHAFSRALPTDSRCLCAKL